LFVLFTPPQGIGLSPKPPFHPLFGNHKRNTQYLDAENHKDIEASHITSHQFPSPLALPAQPIQSSPSPNSQKEEKMTRQATTRQANDNQNNRKQRTPDHQYRSFLPLPLLLLLSMITPTFFLVRCVGCG
jgi:hypothetical protein